MKRRIWVTVVIAMAAIGATVWLWAIGDHSDINVGQDKVGESVTAEGESRFAIPVEGLRITVTYDNNPHLSGLRPAWGFSCFIRGPQKSILFDTGGDAPVLLKNMDSLSIKPDDVDIVVISHAHGDHTGGLNALLDENPGIAVYLPESFSVSFKKQVREYGADVFGVNNPTEVCRGVYSVGQLGTSIKEQSLVISTDKGLIVITGCAHPGIGLIVNKAKEVFEANVLLAMGGFHLSRASESEIKAVIADLKKAGLRYAGPCHCSGDEARRLFKEAFGDHYIGLGVGSTLAGSDLQ